MNEMIKKIFIFSCIFVVISIVGSVLTSQYPPIFECREIGSLEAKGQSIQTSVDFQRFCDYSAKFLFILSFLLALVVNYFLFKEKTIKQKKK